MQVSAIFLVLVGNSLADHGLLPALLGAGATRRLLELARPLGLGAADRLWTVAAWLVVVPTAWAPSLRQISWLSAAGVLLLLGLVALVLFAATAAVLGGGGGEDGSVAAGHEASAGAFWRERQDELPADAAAWRALPCAFAMVAFSFSCRKNSHSVHRAGGCPHANSSNCY